MQPHTRHSYSFIKFPLELKPKNHLTLKHFVEYFYIFHFFPVVFHYFIFETLNRTFTCLNVFKEGIYLKCKLP